MATPSPTTVDDDSCSRFLSVVDELTGLVRGKVTLGSVGVVASVDLRRLLADFHRRHPSVEISLWEAQIVADELIVAAVGPSNPVADRDTIQLMSLRDRPLIIAPTRKRRLPVDARHATHVPPRARPGRLHPRAAVPVTRRLEQL